MPPPFDLLFASFGPDATNEQYGGHLQLSADMVQEAALRVQQAANFAGSDGRMLARLLMTSAIDNSPTITAGVGIDRSAMLDRIAVLRAVVRVMKSVADEPSGFGQGDPMDSRAVEQLTEAQAMLDRAMVQLVDAESSRPISVMVLCLLAAVVLLLWWLYRNRADSVPAITRFFQHTVPAVAAVTCTFHLLLRCMTALEYIPESQRFSDEVSMLVNTVALAAWAVVATDALVELGRDLKRRGAISIAAGAASVLIVVVLCIVAIVQHQRLQV